MKEPKLKKCIICKAEFKQFKSTEKVCSLKCAVEHARNVSKEVKAKEWNKTKKIKKEALKSNRDWINDTQKVVNKYIRERDKGENCISCGKFINGVRHASHYMSAGHNTAVRFNTDNIWVSCYKCNVMLAGNVREYRERLIEKIGIERVEAVELASKEVKRFSIEELKEIMILFKKMTKELKEYYKQQIKKL